MLPDEETRTDFKVSGTVEMTIVSLAPTRPPHPSVALKKLAPALQAEKQSWKGIDTSFSGFLQGLKTRVNSQEQSEREAKCREMMRELTPEPDPRPVLVKFQPARDPQMMKDGLPLGIYARTSPLQSQDLTYKLYKAEGKLLRSVLDQAGFTSTEVQDWNILWTGAAPVSSLFEGLSEYQKINHFPAATELTRKDQMYANIAKMQRKHGKTEFDFVPETFVLPREIQDFTTQFQASQDVSWIAKPSASSQGKGIFLVESIDQLPLHESYIVSQYIANPLLINNLKFDMRIYVLVTSYDPLRIYVYEEGLARFASEEYTGLSRKDARFMHLTNYSVNKKNANYIQNQDYRKDNIGHKWSLSALFKHLESLGVDIEFIWAKIYDLVIKSIISVEAVIAESTEEFGLLRGNCFDLFGFDVLLDSGLKPWLLEVNLSPSLATDSSLDWFIKSHLIADTLNLVGVRAFERRREGYNKSRFRFRNKRKSNENSSVPPVRSQVPIPPVRSSTPLRDLVLDTLEEYSRRGHFLRVYPSQGTDHYNQFLGVLNSQGQSVFSLLFQDFSLERLTELQGPAIETAASASVSTLQQRSRLKFLKPKNASLAYRKVVPNIDVIKDPRGRGTYDKRVVTALARDKSFSSYSTSKIQPVEKIVVTGDDILMEYIVRLIRILMGISEESLTSAGRKNIEAFITHPVWKSSDTKTMGKEALWQRLEGRYTEMKIRRIRITESESRIRGGIRENPVVDEQRRNVVAGFTAGQLEDMLRASTRNIAREVVMPLIDHAGGGVLSDLLASLAIQKSVSSQLRQANPEENDSGEEESDKSPVMSPRSKRRGSLEQISVPQVLRVSWKLAANKKRPQSMAKSMRG